jgi:hypothetical protein
VFELPVAGTEGSHQRHAVVIVVVTVGHFVSAGKRSGPQNLFQCLFFDSIFPFCSMFKWVNDDGDLSIA